MTKNQCQNKIQQAIKHAKENGFVVVVATDEEGNNYKELNPLDMIYDGTKENVIALGVCKYIDESEIFQEE